MSCAAVLSPSTLDFVLKSPRPALGPTRTSSLMRAVQVQEPLEATVPSISEETRTLIHHIDDAYTRQRATKRRTSLDLCNVVKEETATLLQGKDKATARGLLDQLVSEFTILQDGPSTKHELPVATMSEKHALFPKVRQFLREVQADCAALVRPKTHARSSSLPIDGRSRSSSSSSCSSTSSLESMNLAIEHNVPKIEGVHDFKEALEPMVHPHRHLNHAQQVREMVVLTAGHHTPADAIYLFV